MNDISGHIKLYLVIISATAHCCDHDMYQYCDTIITSVFVLIFISSIVIIFLSVPTTYVCIFSLVWLVLGYYRCKLLPIIIIIICICNLFLSCFSSLFFKTLFAEWKRSFRALHQQNYGSCQEYLYVCIMSILCHLFTQ